LFYIAITSLLTDYVDFQICRFFLVFVISQTLENIFATVIMGH